MTTLFMHHYYVPKKAQGYVCKTDAHLQFDNADHIGTDAIYETYHRLFSEWKSNSVLLIELVLVLNHRIGFWSDMIKRGSNVQKGRDFTLVYLELYEKTEKYLIKTFPILCTIYNKVVTKYSSVLNCKTVLR